MRREVRILEESISEGPPQEDEPRTMIGENRPEQLFKASLPPLSQSEGFAHPIVQISLLASAYYVFYSAPVFLFLSSNQPQNANPAFSIIFLITRSLSSASDLVACAR